MAKKIFGPFLLTGTTGVPHTGYMSRYMEELAELLAPVGTFTTGTPFDNASPSDPEYALDHEGNPRFVTKRDMADADRQSIEADDEAALEYAEETARMHDDADWRYYA